MVTRSLYQRSRPTDTLAQQCLLASYQHYGDGSRWQLRIPCCGSYHTRSRICVAEVRRHLLDHLHSNHTRYLRGVAVTSGAGISLQSLQASLMPFVGSIWDPIEWFDSDRHSRLTADAYDIVLVMVTYDYSNVVIQACSSFQSDEAIRAAPPTARLLGMVFSGCGGAGHWDSIDIERAREYAG